MFPFTPVGPPQGWGPPNPVLTPTMQKLPGHDYVWCQSGPTQYGGWHITCICRYCGQQYQRDCNFPPKSGSWIAMFAARHAHGNQAQQQAWEYEYHHGLHRLRAAYPGAQ